MRLPPTHPHRPNISPPRTTAKRVAATGSNEKIRAVSVGLRIFCAQIIIRIAKNVASIPVIRTAKMRRFDHMIVWDSVIWALISENSVTNPDWTKKNAISEEADIILGVRDIL